MQSGMPSSGPWGSRSRAEIDAEWDAMVRAWAGRLGRSPAELDAALDAFRRANGISPQPWVDEERRVAALSPEELDARWEALLRAYGISTEPLEGNEQPEAGPSQAEQS